MCECRFFLGSCELRLSEILTSRGTLVAKIDTHVCKGSFINSVMRHTGRGEWVEVGGVVEGRGNFDRFRSVTHPKIR